MRQNKRNINGIPLNILVADNSSHAGGIFVHRVGEILRTFTAAFLMLFSLSSCITHPNPDGGPLVLNRPVQANQQRVILYRMPSGLSFDQTPEVDIGNTKIGVLPEGSFADFNLPPGDAVVILRHTKNEPWKYKPIGVKISGRSGDTTFIRLDINHFDSVILIPFVGGVWTDKAGLQIVDQTQAIVDMQDLRQMSMSVPPEWTAQP
jgi:hypothetical protein